jgi:hypothetical protein
VEEKKKAHPRNHDIDEHGDVSGGQKPKKVS